MANGNLRFALSLAGLLLLGGCATTDDPDLAESSRPSPGGFERCEYVAMRGSHIKRLRCQPPRGQSERLRALSGTGGSDQLTCTGSKDLCDRIRGHGG